MRHAFLIIAHNNPEILYAQLDVLHSENADFYYHLDSRMQIDKNRLKDHAKESKLFFVKSQKIQWGDYSQIDCELRLLEASIHSRIHYDYFHLLSGVDMPIKTFQTIDQFFADHQGKEFIHFDSYNADCLYRERISFYHLFPGRLQWQIILDGIFVKIQRMCKIDRIRKKGWTIQKGANWFSITQELAKWIVDKKKEVEKDFQYSFCADEVFLQTLVYNSKFRENLYWKMFDDDYHSCMRLVDWKRGNPYIFGKEDVDDLIDSDYMFARKFDYMQKPEAIDTLRECLMVGSSK